MSFVFCIYEIAHLQLSMRICLYTIACVELSTRTCVYALAKGELSMRIYVHAIASLGLPTRDCLGEMISACFNPWNPTLKNTPSQLHSKHCIYGNTSKELPLGNWLCKIFCMNLHEPV